MSQQFSTQRKKRGRYHHGDLRRAMVEAAIKLIARKGAEAFTLREAARVVGVDHRAAYRHFADKGALLAAVSEEGWRNLARRVERATAPKTLTADDRIAALVKAFYRFAKEHPAHYQVMSGPRLNESGRFPSLEAVTQGALDLMGAVVRKSIETDEETARDLAFAMFAMTLGYCELALSGRLTVPNARAEGYLVRLVMQLVAASRAGDREQHELSVERSARSAGLP